MMQQKPYLPEDTRDGWQSSHWAEKNNNNKKKLPPKNQILEKDRVQAVVELKCNII